MTDFGMPTLIEIPDLEQSAALCRRLGLKFMEINMSFPQYQPECLDADRLLELKEKYGIYFTVHIDESLDPACVNAGVAQAYLDSSPMFVISGQANSRLLNYEIQTGIRQHGTQSLNLEPIVSPITKYFAAVMKPEDIRFLMEKA